MTILIVGLGLIGGSMGLALRDRHRVIGYDSRPEHARRAVERGMVHAIVSPEPTRDIDVIALCIPVDAIRRELPVILDRISPHVTVIDTGSTKRRICDAVRHHAKRNRFVACHPIAGTEFSGPDAAEQRLFQDRVCLVVESELSDIGAVEMAEEVWKDCGMSIERMPAGEHDRSLALASHLPHAIAFALAQTVGGHDGIDRVSGSGLAGAIRLARSSPHTWSAILSENSIGIVEAIDAFTQHLAEMKRRIQSGDSQSIAEFIQDSNFIMQTIGRS